MRDEQKLYLREGVRKYLKRAVLGLAIFVTLLATFTRVGPRQFGLRTTGYVLLSDHTLNPGVTAQVPFLQYTHKYDANTQTITLDAGGCRFLPWCNSTGDQNPLRANMVLQYQVDRNVEDLGFHQWQMEGFFFPDGYWLLTDLLNTSANAALGQKTTAGILATPDQFVKLVHDDLTNRLKLNNIPVTIKSVELKDFHTWFVPLRVVSYGVVKN